MTGTWPSSFTSWTASEYGARPSPGVKTCGYFDAYKVKSADGHTIIVGHRHHECDFSAAFRPFRTGFPVSGHSGRASPAYGINALLARYKLVRPISVKT